MKESRWSPDLPARLYWTLPLFLFVITVGFEVVEVLVLEGEGIQGLLESAHLAEITFFTVLCALLGLALHRLRHDLETRAETERNLRRRNRELTILSEVGKSLAKNQHVESVFSHTLEAVVSASAACGGSIYGWDAEQNKLFLRAQAGCCRRGRCTTPVGAVALEGDDLMASGTSFAGPLPCVEDDGETSMRTWALIPLLSPERPVGLLVLCLGDVTTEDRALLDALGYQIGTRVEAALLAQQSVQRAERIAALGNVVHRLVAITDPQALIQHVWSGIQEVIDFNQGILYRYFTDPERMEPVAWKGFTTEEVREIAAYSLERHPGWVVRNCEPVLAGDTENDERVRYHRLTNRSASCLHVPIHDEDRCLGVIGLGSNEKYAFSSEDLDVVSAFADGIAVAMRNAENFRELQEVKEQWETTFNAITDGISIHDRNMRIVRANQALANLLNRSREELIGQPCYQVFHHTDEPVPGCPLVETLHSGHPAAHEMEDAVLGGIFRTATFPIKGENGTTIGGVHIIQDVTEETRMRRQMMQMEKLSAIGELVSGVAHELNNPLTAVLGYAQLLQARNVDETTRGDLRRIEQQAQRAAKIVQNLLTFARQHEPEQEWIAINDLLLRTISLKAYDLRTENIRVVSQLSPDLPLLKADPYQLQQVFLNILNNAHQAIADSRQGDKIVVTSEMCETKDGRHVRVSIHNNGPDIPPATVSRIFDPFFTTKEVGKGTGLGLSISYGIIQEHGGRIWAENPPGDGPTFFIDLPVRQAAGHSLLHPADQQKHPVPPAALTDTRILIVEDEESLRRFLAEALSSNGKQVDTAANGVEAMHLMALRDYDLVVADIKMPGMGGDDLYDWAARERAELANRMVFITGDMVNPHTKEFLSRANRPHLAKPFTIEEFYALLEEAAGNVPVREETPRVG